MRARTCGPQEKPGRRELRVLRSTCSPGVNNTLTSCQTPSRHSVHPSWWATSLITACLWSQMCFGRESIRMAPAGCPAQWPSQCQLTAAARLQGSHSGPAKCGDLLPPAQDRGEGMGAGSPGWHSAEIPGGQVLVSAVASPSPLSFPFLSSLFTVSLQGSI